MIETFANGITREWLDNKQIAIHTFTKVVTRPAIDTWFETVFNSLQQEEKYTVLAAMHDFSAVSGRLPMLYIRQRAAQLVDMSPKHKPAYTALVLQNKLEVQMTKFFLNTLARPLGIQQIRIFATREEGIAWLRACIAKHTQPQAIP